MGFEALALEAVKKLPSPREVVKLSTAFVRRHWKLVATCSFAGVAVAAVVNSTAPPLFEATIIVEPVNNSSHRESIVIQSHHVLSCAASRMPNSKGSNFSLQNLKLEPGDTQGSAQPTSPPRLKATPRGETGLIQISTTASDTATASLLAETIVDCYLEWSIQHNMETLETEINIISDLMAQLENQLPDTPDSKSKTAGPSRPPPIQSELLRKLAFDKVEIERSKRAIRRENYFVGTPRVFSLDTFALTTHRLAKGFYYGMGIGMAAALLLSLLDNKLRTVRDFEEALGLATLLVIPDLNKSGRRGKSLTEPIPIELVPHLRPSLAISEIFRRFRTNLAISIDFKEFSKGQEFWRQKTISETSLGAGDGKSSNCCNMSIVLAQMGLRVLLMDCDLRRPRLHKIFKVSNRLGLVNYLISAPRDESQLIKPTEIPQLSLLTSGPIPPNPSELLASSAFLALVSNLRKQFDVIVIDTPPLPVSETTLLAGICDGTVLCFRASATTRRDAIRSVDHLERAGVKTLGMIINRSQEWSQWAGLSYSRNWNSVYTKQYSYDSDAPRDY